MADGIDFNATAMQAAPLPDEGYVNVVLQIDPNWPWLGRIGKAMQGTYRKVVFIFVEQTDEGFHENVSVNYATTDVIGRDEQYKTYTGTDNRSFPMTFRFVEQGEANYQAIVGGTGQQAVDNLLQRGGGRYTGQGGSLMEVMEPARWIESLQHAVPDPLTGISYAPPPLLLTVGRLFAARVVMTDCSIHWEGPFAPGTMLPHGATLECTFTTVRAAMDVEGPYGNLAGIGGVPTYNRFLDFPTQGPRPTQGT